MAEEYPQPVFLDATVLSNFASTNGLSTVVEMLDTPVVVPAVRGEIEEGVEQGHVYLVSATGAIGGEISVRSVPTSGERTQIRDKLDEGEAESMLGVIKHGGTLSTDDLAARRVAEQRGIPVTGSVGLLVLAVERDHLDRTKADEWLETWRDVRGYYAPVETVSELLADDSR